MNNSKKEFSLVATYNKSPDEKTQTFSEQDDGYCIFLPKLKIRPGLSAVFRTLDSLLSQEQLVTKLCCAILGEQFSRDMLLYVVNPSSQREFALTIKKLFELKILACAKRDFSSSTVIVTSEDTVSPQSYEDITCECRDNKIQETCLDLPKYASCSYMKFCNTYIPDITYQSSPDQQKREFHLRAMEYLEEQRGHCHICDDGPLGQIFNPTAEHEDIMESLMSQSTSLPSTTEMNFDNRGGISKLKDCQSDTDCKDASCDNIDLNNTDVPDITYELSADEQKREVHSHAIENLEKQRRHCRICDYRFLHKILDPTAELDSMESLNNQPTPSTSEQSDLSTVTVPVTPTGINVDNCEDTDEFKSIFGFRCILKLRNFNLLTGNLSTEDSQDCQCLPILSTAYSEITAYYEDVGRDFMKLSKIIDIMLHYASVLIKSSNPSLALTVLENALNVLKTTPRTDLSSWQTGLVRGKIHGLMGHAYMELHVFEDLSESHLKLALKYYNHEFSFVKLSNKSKALQSRLKQYFGLLVLPNAIEKKNSSRLEAYICNNVSEVLSHLAVLFMKKNLWPYAELAATESLSEALKTYNNFELLCSTYSNMLLIALHYKYKKLSAAIEINALCLSGTKTGSMTRNELKTVTKLYASIFWYALPHADIEKITQIGDNALRTAISIQAPQLIWPILPMLMFVCLLKKDVNTAVYILDNLRLFNEHNQYNEKKSGTLWYLSQCISFHLETGYTVVPYDECEKLGRAMVYMCIKDKAALNHYCVTMWLWCVRNCNWEKTTFWYSKIKRFYQLKDNDCVANKLTGLYLLEGLITSLVYKIDDAAVPTCNNIEREIKHLIKTMEKSAKTMEIILTRLFHMKAYYRAVRYNSVNLLKAYKLAVKYNNVLEQEWVMHSLKTWNKTLDEAALNFWQEHCNEQNHLYYHEMEPNGEFLYFTLPIPSRRRK